MLISTNTIEERALYAQNYLMQIICADRMDPCLMNTVHDILSSGGREKISALAEKNAVSKKKLERIFSEKMGISPKSFSSLVRYQKLWQDMCFSADFDIFEAVVKYGFAEGFQEISLHDPKTGAGKCKNVAFLQYRQRIS